MITKYVKALGGYKLKTYICLGLDIGFWRSSLQNKRWIYSPLSFLKLVFIWNSLLMNASFCTLYHLLWFYILIWRIWEATCYVMRCMNSHLPHLSIWTSRIMSTHFFMFYMLSLLHGSCMMHGLHFPLLMLSNHVIYFVFHVNISLEMILLFGVENDGHWSLGEWILIHVLIWCCFYMYKLYYTHVLKKKLCQIFLGFLTTSYMSNLRKIGP